MRCPYCHEDEDRVIDSRSSEGGQIIRRRRLCQACDKRFTTYERIEERVKLAVIKKDGTRVAYDRSKLIGGLQKACWKREISAEQLRALVDSVEEEVFEHSDREVTSALIGELVADRLRKLDRVAYVRFASVYREFKDVGEFIEEAQDLMARPPESPGQQQLFDKS